MLGKDQDCALITVFLLYQLCLECDTVLLSSQFKKINNRNSRNTNQFSQNIKNIRYVQGVPKYHVQIALH